MASFVKKRTNRCSPGRISVNDEMRRTEAYSIVPDAPKGPSNDLCCLRTIFLLKAHELCWLAHLAQLHPFSLQELNRKKGNVGIRTLGRTLLRRYVRTWPADSHLRESGRLTSCFPPRGGRLTSYSHPTGATCPRERGHSLTHRKGDCRKVPKS